MKDPKVVRVSGLPVLDPINQRILGSLRRSRRPSRLPTLEWARHYAPTAVNAVLGRLPRRLCAVVLVGGLIGFGIGAAPAAARVIDHDQFHDVDSQIFELCGLTLRFDLDIRGMFMDNSHGRDGLVYFTETHHGTVSWTNLSNGLTMTEVFNNIQKDLKVTNNGDGTLTLVEMISGVHNVKGPDGRIERMDPGTIRFEVLVDDGGTPTDPSDDEELDVRIIKEGTGPNELGDFCADVHEVIG
jgi:hypothetical protein